MNCSHCGGPVDVRTKSGGKPQRFCSRLCCDRAYKRSRGIPPLPTLEQRLWGRVDKKPDGCWIWTGSTSGTYGQIGVDGNNRQTHRVAYELTKGPIPKGKFVCHMCDQPLCINPDHLFLGAPADNSLDMTNKGRQAREFALPFTKVSDRDVAVMRHLFASGTDKKVLEERFGISRGHLNNILTVRTRRLTGADFTRLLKSAGYGGTE